MILLTLRVRIYNRSGDQMNEPLFSNIFIEKRGFSTWKALRYKGFLSLHLINAPAKIPKCQTIIERNSFFE